MLDTRDAMIIGSVVLALIALALAVPNLLRPKPAPYVSPIDRAKDFRWCPCLWPGIVGRYVGTHYHQRLMVLSWVDSHPTKPLSSAMAVELLRLYRPYFRMYDRVDLDLQDHCPSCGRTDGDRAGGRVDPGEAVQAFDELICSLEN